MAELKEARVPDIGDYSGVPVIEVLVSVGDTVAKDQSLITLESDKATLEVPAPFAGVVKELKVKLGDELSEGAVVAMIEVGDSASLPPPGAAARNADAAQEVPSGDEGEKGKSSAKSAPPPAAEQRTLPETPTAGTGEQVEPVAPSAAPDKIAQREIAQAQALPTGAPSQSQADGSSSEKSSAGDAPNAGAPVSPPVEFNADAVLPQKVPHASPAVRLMARELGVDLLQIKGSERAGRISKEDVQRFVKAALAGGGASGAPAAGGGGGGLNLLPWPKVDFAKFGEVETRPLSRIQKLSGANLARNWAMIPHVTQHDHADITDLEDLRVVLNKENADANKGGAGIKVTMLAFLLKATVAALKKYPDFNASLDASGENLVLKKYFHIGFAADTPNGLVVPVIRNVDQKGVADLAKEMGQLASKAREGKLGPAEMSGGCFSISSLGGIGGTAFTPIVNAPEVAILGVSKSSMQPVWDGKQFQPRLQLPLSLSYDHRVIDGASAARFTAYLAQLLGDMRRVLL